MRTSVIENLIRKSEGRVFGVTFIPRGGGDERTMSARLGVSKGVSGRGMAFNPSDHNLINVYDMNEEGHQNIPLDGITSLTIDGESY